MWLEIQPLLKSRVLLMACAELLTLLELCGQDFGPRRRWIGVARKLACGWKSSHSASSIQGMRGIAFSAGRRTRERGARHRGCSCRAAVRLSRFVYTFHDVRPGEHVLYDVVNDRYLGLDGRALEALDRWKTDPPRDEREAEVAGLLRQEEFLVADEAEDETRLRRYLEAACLGIPGTLYVTLMPTLACNLACTYCFQKDQPATAKMDERVEGEMVQWVLGKLDVAGCRRLLVHYFGGEPLTRKDFLLRTAGVFHASMAARCGVFEWELTTNGVGLDVEFVRAMGAEGAGAIKVTLDGDKETHDAARVRRDGRGTFDEVFANAARIAKECPDIKLRVGGNFRPDQRPSYERLLDRLEAEGLKGHIDKIRFKPVIEARPGERACGGCGSSAAEAELALELARLVHERGLSKQESAVDLPSGPCELHWKNSYVIDPSGNVYKCPAVAGRKEMAIEAVCASKGRCPPKVEIKVPNECGDCPCVPVCAGGCQAASYLTTRRFGEARCEREKFEKAFREDAVSRYLVEFPEAVAGTN